MKVQIISFHCTLKNNLGHTIGSSFNRDVINQLEKESDPLAGLVAGLQNIKSGEKRQVAVSASQAYGLYDQDLVIEVPRKALRTDGLAPTFKTGSTVKWQTPEMESPREFRVVSSTPELITLDGNHPLAGQDLVFDIEVVSARDAKKEDLQVDIPSTQVLH